MRERKAVVDYWCRRVLLLHMEATDCQILRLIELDQPRDVCDDDIANIDKRLIWEAKELERLGFRRYAVRVRAAVSGIIPRPKDRPIIDPAGIPRGETLELPRGGPWRVLRNGGGGSGQSGGLRIDDAPIVAAVSTPREWH